MKLRTISQVSKQFKISTRTLRYYEQIGLINSTLKEDYSYRAYDEDTILRLKQIIVLRKLRVPLKSIAEVLLKEDTVVALKVFQQNLSEIEDEITALNTIKSVIQSFIIRLNIKDAKLELLDDDSLLEIVDSITTSKINFKEDKTMDDLIKADEKLSKLTDRNVRIVYLPPATVASIRSTGSMPETETGDILFNFIKESKLPNIKPDFRHFGFNIAKDEQAAEGNDHGYERWVTIPDDMELPERFEKKCFPGGLYGAHMIPMGAFEEWNRLYEWANNHERFEIAWGDPACMHGFIEEHLDAFHHYLWSHEECDKNLQLDLLIPIKEKAVKN